MVSSRKNSQLRRTSAMSFIMRRKPSVKAYSQVVQLLSGPKAMPRLTCHCLPLTIVGTHPAMAKSIFYDPDRKRWGRLRILLSVLGAVISALVLFFIVTVFLQSDPLPHVLMPEQKRNLHALKEREHRKRPSTKNTHRKTKAPPSQVVLNT